MKKPLENKIVLYSIIVISTLVSLPKLALVFEGSLVRRLIGFNAGEFFFLWGVTALFCWLVFTLNLKWLPAAHNESPLSYRSYAWQNALLLLVSCMFFIHLHRYIFRPDIPLNYTRAMYFMRFAVCLLLELLIVHIIYHLRITRKHESEKEELRRRSTETELELMKQQLNPHFFFNALSTLSGLTREDPVKAQGYISHLSKVFRNLLQSKEQMISLSDELRQLDSYTALLGMRYENGISISVSVPDELLHKKIPHFSLQPLVENAARHNQAIPASPLQISISAEGNMLTVENNLQPMRITHAGAGLGLHNLSERFRLLTGNLPVIKKTSTHFIVQLPLI